MTKEELEKYFIDNGYNIIENVRVRSYKNDYAYESDSYGHLYFDKLFIRGNIEKGDCFVIKKHFISKDTPSEFYLYQIDQSDNKNDLFELWEDHDHNIKNIGVDNEGHLIFCVRLN